MSLQKFRDSAATSKLCQEAENWGRLQNNSNLKCYVVIHLCWYSYPYCLAGMKLHQNFWFSSTVVSFLKRIGMNYKYKAICVYKFGVPTGKRRKKLTQLFDCQLFPYFCCFSFSKLAFCTHRQNYKLSLGFMKFLIQFILKILQAKFACYATLLFPKYSLVQLCSQQLYFKHD